ncbi:MAG: alginate export family protein [Planctomycetes bacterium]|nr:alginate export family protein [Planctomycetota bacterium]
MNILLSFGLILSSALGALQEKPPPATPAPVPQEETLFKSLVKQVTLGGQIRIRGEYRDPTAYFNTAAATRSDDVFLTRIRLNLKFSVTDDIDVFVQPQDQRSWGQEANLLTDERNLDLHQGYAEIRNLLGEPLSIRAGRFEMSYGDQRLISPLDWHNVARAWDGAKVRYAPKDWWIEAFYTVIRDPLTPSPPAPPVFSPAPTGANGAAEDQDFMGVYFSYVGVADHEFDLYAFFREFQDNSFADELGGVGDLIDHTFGARVKGKDLGFEWTLEAMTQGGHLSQDRIQAYAYAATLAYALDLAWKPRIGLEYAYASGDRTPANGTHGTFDPLFPFFHAYQGYADVFGFKNSKSLSVYLKVAPTDTVSLHLDAFAFWLAQARDSWYNDPGAALRTDPTGASSRKIGTEFDFHAKVAVGKYVKFWGGWSHVVAGEFIRKTAAPIGTDVDLDWFFLQMTVDF